MDSKRFSMIYSFSLFPKKMETFTFKAGSLALAILTAGVLPLSAQTDPSIGRNLPGGQPRVAPSDFTGPGETQIPEPPAMPIVKSIGTPGRVPLRSIIYSNNANSLKVPLKGVTAGVSLQGVDLIAENQKFQDRIAGEFIGQKLTAELVQAVSQATLDFYMKKSRPVVFIQPLVANYSNGTLEVLVVEATLEEKIGQGARWFSNPMLANTLRVKPGQYINRRKLLNDLTWINENPFLRSDVVFAPGMTPGTTKIILETKDRFPVRAYAGIENTGSEQSGEWRWLVGANWGNAFFLNQQLNYQFSAAFASIYSQPVHAASWVVPLPWRHRLAIYGTYASSESDIGGAVGAPDLSYNGYSLQISPRYTIPIGNLYGSALQEIVIGFDWKSSDFGFNQAGDYVPTNQTDVVQFMAGYNGGLTDKFGRTTFGFEVFWSPGGIGSRNSDAAFEAVDPRLQANYLYALLRLGRTTQLPYNFSLITQASGQLASAPLISSEQLSIGGYGTVRGYDERVIFGDQGAVVNVELRTPSISIGRLAGWDWLTDELQFLGFWDFGLVSSKDPLPGDAASYYLSSLGVGLRYSLAPYVSVRCDVGFPLVDPDVAGVDVGIARASVGVTVGF